MKILLFCIANFFFQSQPTIDLKFLQQSVLSRNTQTLQEHLTPLNFDLSKSYNTGEGDECLENYMFKRDIQNPFPFSEVIILARTCKHNVWFNSLRLATRDKNEFENIKASCIASKNYAFTEDGIENEYLTQTYKGDNWEFIFKTGKDHDVSAYILDIVYDFPTIPIK